MKYLKGKTWIDWVKAIVAIDITAVGIGLIFQQKIHILADLFGPVSRIIFGILYILVAVAIFKIVFPELFEDLRDKSSKVKEDIHNEVSDKPQEDIEPKETVGEMIDKAAKKIDTFVQGKAKEVKEEVKKELGDIGEEASVEEKE